MYVRFDDLRPGQRRHLVFGEPQAALRADEPEGVRRLLEKAEEQAGRGRWVAGFVAYEAAPGLDQALQTHQPPANLPVAWFGVFKEPAVEPMPEEAPFSFGPWQPDLTREEYDDAITTIRRHIRAGNSYQVNMTLRLHSHLEGDALAAYRALIEGQSGGFGAYLDIGSHVVMSASPELFFRWDEGQLLVRPMKGTVPRGRWSGEDETLRAGLRASEKNRAENLMIVDMLRNDLGRVAEFGSVAVPELFETERYDTVWQMTSTITARPRSGTSLADVFGALFPSGSVTGAPKVRTMGIIRDLEPAARGVYCGAIGLLAPPGSQEPRAQFNVAIRTVVIDTDTDRAEYGTGGGITWDSTASSEYDEAMLKAAVLTVRRPPFSLFETFRWEPGEGPVRLEGHLARLAASAHYFGFPLDQEKVRAAVAGVTGSSRLRVQLVLHPDGEVRVEVSATPTAHEPVWLAVDDMPVDPTDVLLFHKTTRRNVYEEAAARHPQADDVVLINQLHRLTETTIGNLAVRFGPQWVTPPLDDGCLPGVYRAELLEKGELIEESIAVDRLGEADELAVVSSLRGWRRAQLVAS